MGVLINLTGKRFGRLTVIRQVENGKWNKPQWLCKCDCGGEKTILGSQLRTGMAKSCGCIHKEVFNNIISKHGMCGSRFYRIYQAMKTRCLNKNRKRYKDYGGRGIKVCDKWLKFEGFRDDMYKSYLKHSKQFGEKNTSIDRIDVNGNYCKRNCKWSTNLEQARNKR